MAAKLARKGDKQNHSSRNDMYEENNRLFWFRLQRQYRRNEGIKYPFNDEARNKF